jgi:hypothetical protein
MILECWCRYPSISCYSSIFPPCHDKVYVSLSCCTIHDLRSSEVIHCCNYALGSPCSVVAGGAAVFVTVCVFACLTVNLPPFSGVSACLDLVCPHFMFMVMLIVCMLACLSVRASVCPIFVSAKYF